jgi:hypothetical protein
MISKKLANHPVQDSRVPLPVFREGATVSLPGHGLTKYVYNDANENPRPQGENPDPAGSCTAPRSGPHRGAPTGKLSE